MLIDVGVALLFTEEVALLIDEGGLLFQGEKSRAFLVWQRTPYLFKVILCRVWFWREFYLAVTRAD